MFGVMFAILATIDYFKIRELFGQRSDTVFSMTGAWFDGFLALIWTVGVLFLLGCTLLTLFYREAARLTGNSLIHISRLGPLRVLFEYELARIRELGIRNERGLGRIDFELIHRLRRRFNDAIAFAGPGLSDILWREVSYGERMREAESALGWPARAGRLVLGLALDRLAVYYRIA